MSASVQQAVYAGWHWCCTPYPGLTKERQRIWLADGSRLSWSPLAECGCPRGAALGKVARRADRAGGRRGELTFCPSRLRVWSPLMGGNGVDGKPARVC